MAGWAFRLCWRMTLVMQPGMAPARGATTMVPHHIRLPVAFASRVLYGRPLRPSGGLCGPLSLLSACCHACTGGASSSSDRAGTSMKTASSLASASVICQRKNTVCQVNCHAARRASADSLCHITRPDIGDLSPVAHCLLFSFPCSPCGHDTWQKCQQMRQRCRIFRISQVYFLLRIENALIAREAM